MRKEVNKKMAMLNNAEMKKVNGGYVKPTKEQLERLREIYGPMAEYIICF